MSYITNLKRALNVAVFKDTYAKELADDANATGHGFLTLAIVGLFSGILTMITTPLGTSSLILGPLGMILGFIIGYSIYHFFAKIFGGKASGTQYFRVMSNVMIVYIVASLIDLLPLSAGIIQTLGFIVGIYLVAVNIVVLKNVHQLSMPKAVIVGLMPLILIMVLGFLLGLTIGFSFIA